MRFLKHAQFVVVALILFFCALPLSEALALPSSDYGAACTTTGITETADATGNNLICDGAHWRYPAYILGGIGSGGTSGACNSGTAGALQWTGSALQYCNGSGWTSVATPPAAFSFTDQTGIALSTTTTSNAVALSGFTGPLAAACGTGCTAIARNGTWGGIGVAGFVSGDTIAIQQTSSASYNTPTTASVTVGGTTSSTWTVTSTVTANAFSFTDQTGVALNATTTSNAVTLAGGFVGLTATCGTGCTGISRNGAAFTAGPVSGFNSGDTIAIRLTSSVVGYNTAVTASVTVGSTTSSTWTVTTTPTASAFSFIDQTGLALSTTTTSNAVTLAGGFTNLTATCKLGCTAISKNGAAFASSPVAGFNSGDTIAIKMISNSNYNAAKAASVTVGGTTSSAWNVTTAGVNSFSFTNQTGVTASSTITSNTVTLAGGFSGATATCGTGCTGISRNGGGFVAGPVSGFNSGDTIAIQQTSASSGLSVASVTVGNMTSNPWGVTTENCVKTVTSSTTSNPTSSTITLNYILYGGGGGGGGSWEISSTAGGAGGTSGGGGGGGTGGAGGGGGSSGIRVGGVLQASVAGGAGGVSYTTGVGGYSGTAGSTTTGSLVVNSGSNLQLIPGGGGGGGAAGGTTSTNGGGGGGGAGPAGAGSNGTTTTCGTGGIGGTSGGGGNGSAGGAPTSDCGGGGGGGGYGGGGGGGGDGGGSNGTGGTGGNGGSAGAAGSNGAPSTGTILGASDPAVGSGGNGGGIGAGGTGSTTNNGGNGGTGGSIVISYTAASCFI